MKQGRGLSPFTLVQQLLGKAAGIKYPVYLRMLAYLSCITYGLFVPYGEYAGWAILAFAPVIVLEYLLQVRDTANRHFVDVLRATTTMATHMQLELTRRYHQVEERKANDSIFEQVSDVAEEMQYRLGMVSDLVRQADSAGQDFVKVSDLEAAINS